MVRYLQSQKTSRNKIVVDLGCGTGRMLDLLQGTKFDARGFDHVNPMNRPDVTACDFKHTGLEDHSVDYVTMCLAMWGTDADYDDYFAEARRILDSNGKLIIVESFKRWVIEDVQTGERLNLLTILLKKHGFVVQRVEEDKFMLLIASVV